MIHLKSYCFYGKSGGRDRKFPGNSRPASYSGICRNEQERDPVSNKVDNKNRLFKWPPQCYSMCLHTRMHTVNMLTKPPLQVSKPFTICPCNWTLLACPRCLAQILTHPSSRRLPETPVSWITLGPQAPPCHCLPGSAPLPECESQQLYKGSHLAIHIVLPSQPSVGMQ